MLSRALISIRQKSDLAICERMIIDIENIIPVYDEKQNNRFYKENLINKIRSVIYKHQYKPFNTQKAIEFNERSTCFIEVDNPKYTTVF